MGCPAPAAATRRAGLALVFAAAVYDALLCLAIAFAATALAVAANGGRAVPPGTLLYELYLLAVLFPYFGWCWVRGGATLGMRAWRLRLRRGDGAPVTWSDALARYLGAWLSLAPLGLGWLWMRVDRDGCSWHDRLSGTRIWRE